MTSFPENWITKDLEICVEILDNKRIPVNSDERAKRQGDIPYYGATGQAGWIDDYIFNEELVLVGEDGAPFFEKEKNVAFMINGKSWVNNHAHVLKAINGVTLNKFVLHYLNHFDYKDFVGGTTRLKLNQGSLRKIPFPVPPLPEQKRIVAKLDNLFAHLDQLKARLQNIPTLLKQFRQAVLTQAVTGKLTEEWRNENVQNNVQELIGRISKERELLLKTDKRWSKTIYKDDNLDSDLPERVPPNWKIVKWSEVGLSQNGKSFPSKDYTDDGIKLLRPGNLNVNGKVEWSVHNTKCLPIHYKDSSQEFVIREGEIIMNLTAQSLKDEFLGRVCLTEKGEECLLNQRQARIKPIGLEVKFCFWLLKATPFRKFVDQLNTGTLIQHMYTSQLDQFRFALPPLEEQKEIVRRVESLFAVADRIEASYTKLQEKIDHLPQAILSKAFRGELIFNDELVEI